MTVEADYRRLLASAPEGKRLYETIELGHPQMSQTYRFVRDSVDLVADDEDGVERTWTAINMGVKGFANLDDLDQLASFTLPDIDNVLDGELDRIDIDSPTKPTVTYRVYHSDHLDEVAEGPYLFDIEEVNQEPGKFTIKSGVPRLNSEVTGITYNLTDFPMLRGIV